MTDEVNNVDVTSETEAQPESAAPHAPEEIQALIEKLQNEAQGNLNGWQRERADFANYKRRIEKEVKESRERGALDAVTLLLPVIDDFERALQNLPAELADNAWVSGTSLISKKLYKVLEEFNVEIIDPVGEVFDPHRHEAIGTDASTDEIASGHVTVTLQKGYASGERVLRSALVKIAG